MTPEPFNPDLIQAPAEAPAVGTAAPITVSQLTAMVKRAIETSLPPTVHVVGEISNFKRHSSGHLYFTLKDRASELSCVMWRSAAAKLKFTPEDGLEVIATGSVEVFERAGRYQLYVRKLEPRGVGALELAFRQLCDKLSKEGLFDPRHKRPLPRYPQRIALVTSPTGAAIADMLRTVQRRYPCVNILIYPVRVQGPGAATQIADAIRRLNAEAERLGGVDLMIVGRGGGSLEDLWSFNEEIVARAIYASRLPVISAVGHEVDVSIADLVADVRAATPTAAAEIAVPVLDDVLDDLATRESRLHRVMIGMTRLLAARLTGLLQRRAFREPIVAVHRREQSIDELTSRMQRSLMARLQSHYRRLDAYRQTLSRIAPDRYLLRTAVRLRDVRHRLCRVMTRRLAEAQRLCLAGARRMERGSPNGVLPILAEELRGRADALAALMCHHVALMNERVRRQEEVLAALSYKSVLGRGFSITRKKKGRQVVRSVGRLRDRERIVTELADGEFEAEIVNLNQLELFE